MSDCPRKQAMQEIIEKCYNRTLIYRVCINAPGGKSCEEVLKEGKCPKLIEFIEKMESEET